MHRCQVNLQAESVQVLKAADPATQNGAQGCLPGSGELLAHHTHKVRLMLQAESVQSLKTQAMLCDHQPVTSGRAHHASKEVSTLNTRT